MNYFDVVFDCRLIFSSSCTVLCKLISFIKITKTCAVNWCLHPVIICRRSRRWLILSVVSSSRSRFCTFLLILIILLSSSLIEILLKLLLLGHGVLLLRHLIHLSSLICFSLRLWLTLLLYFLELLVEQIGWKRSSSLILLLISCLFSIFIFSLSIWLLWLLLLNVILLHLVLQTTGSSCSCHVLWLLVHLLGVSLCIAASMGLTCCIPLLISLNIRLLCLSIVKASRLLLLELTILIVQLIRLF